MIELSQSNLVPELPPQTPTQSGTQPIASASKTATSVTLGFLTILTDASGVLGGYLVTNSWGRPLEFRLSTAVQPNRVQQILYGPTLSEYLHTDLIGKTLVEKTSIQPLLLVVDSPHALALRGRLDIPTIGVQQPGSSPEGDVLVFRHERSSQPLLLSSRYATDQDEILDRLGRVDPAVDLAEPFARIREAVMEARKMGVSHRAA